MRTPQPEGKRGSLKWIQKAVASDAEVIQPKNFPKINWVSPIASDEFAEYSDASFLNILGLELLKESLSEFWPRRGPQWDALGLTSDGPVLVEAKAHVAEFLSPPSAATGTSLRKIHEAFSIVKRDLNVNPQIDWTATYYQYANRIAFLWWLRKNNVNAKLLFVSFINDVEMNGPKQSETWHALFAAANYALGLPGKHALKRHIFHVMPDVQTLN